MLTFERTVSNSGRAICWVISNKAGARLYTSNTGDNSLSVYDLTDPLAPVEIQKVSLKGAGNAFQITLDSEGRFLYAVSQRASPVILLGQGNALHVLKVDATTGMLTEVPASPVTLILTPGTRPQKSGRGEEVNG